MSPSLVASILERLESHDHRITAPRMAVIGVLATMSGHFTADSLASKVRGVGRATVFRTLKLLADEGVVCRVLLDDGRLHYRLSRSAHHHHLVCTQCGAIEDFTTCDVNDVINELSRRTGYQIESHWLELYGRCQTCSAASPQSAPKPPALA
ncbi:MAG TPA: Fur family transcriptional regulator [Dehalococcoidia bacterium]|nr:Fur family transcriptional regulator [Dehalococcoidia bacterium]